MLCFSPFVHIRVLRRGLWEANRTLFLWPHGVSSKVWQHRLRSSQEEVESVTGAQFTQSDSSDSNPICFGRRGCSQWFGCDWSFLCPWSYHDTIPVSTFIFPSANLDQFGPVALPLLALWQFFGPHPEKKVLGHCCGQQQTFAWKHYCMFTELLGQRYPTVVDNNRPLIIKPILKAKLKCKMSTVPASVDAFL